MVWKPKVTEGWAPYQNGRWRYYDTLGYAWVSDDSWGWMPYHNGRWAHLDNVGWVWQPAVSTVFKPGEVYWLRGANMAGWGPLAPGELWTPATPGVPPPRYFAGGITRFAALQQDARVIDSKGFAAPSAEQLQAAVYVRALPSPAFIAARLDATRPALKVGRTRIDPIVPGVTLTDAPLPADPAMTSPPDDPQPPGDVAADAPPALAPPADGVYPVPVVAIPVVEVQVLSGAAASTTVAPAGGQQTLGHTTATVSPAPTPREIPKERTRKVDPPKNAGPMPPDKRSGLMAPDERSNYQQVLADFNVLVPNLAKSIQDLDGWARDYPNSELANQRQYYYVQAYNGLGRPDKVLEAATGPVAAGVRATYGNAEQILQLLLVTTTNLQRLSQPSSWPPDRRRRGNCLTICRNILRRNTNRRASTKAPGKWCGGSSRSWQNWRWHGRQRRFTPENNFARLVP
jgi:hypothetical protein